MIAFIFLPDFPTTGNRSFTFVQDDALTFPSLWRFPFPITSDALSSNRHSEWTQEYCMRKQGDGYVIRSEESITLNSILPSSLVTVTDPSHSFRMTPYRSPLLVTPFPPIVILNGGKNALWERREMAIWHRVKNLWLWWRLTVSLTMTPCRPLSFWQTFFI